jgi:hypothetical protein
MKAFRTTVGLVSFYFALGILALVSMIALPGLSSAEMSLETSTLATTYQYSEALAWVSGAIDLIEVVLAYLI